MACCAPRPESLPCKVFKTFPTNQQTKMNKLTSLLWRGYKLLSAGCAAMQSPFLRVLRLYFFWQLFLTGKGKLANIGKVSEFFASLGIPLPTLNTYFIGSLECFGGLLLIIGLHHNRWLF